MNINIKHGDIINTIPAGRYRNTGTLIWDALSEHALNLASEFDDYGSIPSEFQVSEDSIFHPMYWSNLISHNRFWNPSDNIRSQCIENIAKNPDETLKLYDPIDQPVPYTTFNLHQVEYTLLFDAHNSFLLNEECFINTLQNMPYCYYYAPIKQEYDEIEETTFCMVIADRSAI